MSDRLKPCPFCGGEMEIHNAGETVRLNGVDYHDDSYTWWHADMKLAVEKDCPLEHEFHDTEDGLIRSWNTRAYTTDEVWLYGQPLVGLTDVRVFGMTLDEVNQMRKRDAERAERTCHVVPHGYCIANGEKSSCRCWSCSECSYGWHVSDYDRQYRYCPNCGARVVE